jgi:putative ABC transport system substrate-binding protein
MTVLSRQWSVVRKNIGEKAIRQSIFLWLLATVLLTTASIAEGQQAVKVPRIGYLSSGSPATSAHLLEAFRQGLQDLGYVEGKNIVIDLRWAEGDSQRIPEMAADLQSAKVDMIVTSGGVATLATKRAAATTVIVAIAVNDPIQLGLIQSLARPGGNVTGLAVLNTEIATKQLELLKEIAPKMSRVGVLSHPASHGPEMLKEIAAAARALGLRLDIQSARDPKDFERAFSALRQARAGALLILGASMFSTNRAALAALALEHRLPAIYLRSEFVEAGGLMTYGENFPDLWRRAATYVDKIIKGTKPADLPVEQPTKFELIINLKAAKQIGLTIPPNVLARADRVIK